MGHGIGLGNHEAPWITEEELVVVTAPVLADPLTRGYSDPFGQVV
jgi:hypothetical protein